LRHDPLSPKSALEIRPPRPVSDATLVRTYVFGVETCVGSWQCGGRMIRLSSQGPRRATAAATQTVMGSLRYKWRWGRGDRPWPAPSTRSWSAGPVVPTGVACRQRRPLVVARVHVSFAFAPIRGVEARGGRLRRAGATRACFTRQPPSSRPGKEVRMRSGARDGAAGRRIVRHEPRRERCSEHDLRMRTQRRTERSSSGE